MLQKEYLTKLIESYLENNDLFLVEISVSKENDVEITIDSEKGVDIENCTEISRIVEAGVDREVEDFSLTVGSAGLSQPFKVLRQYTKFLGEEIELVLKSGEKMRVKLIGVDEEGIDTEFEKSIKEEGKKKKSKVTVKERFTFASIKTAKPFINFR
jgi:ribosome maturation factor RimP